MTVARELTEEQAELVQQLRDVRSQVTTLRDREAELKERVLAMMDGADLGCFDGRDVVVTQTSWRTVLNTKRLRADPTYGPICKLFESQTAVTTVRFP
jgi:predicted phage-related endonuclease